MTQGEPTPRDALYRLTNAYQVSQAIHVAATLGIADLLADRPRTVDELAAATQSHAPSLYRLLRALASVGIFVEGDNGFGLTPMADMLRSDVPGSLRAWAMYIGQPYAWTTWGYLLESVNTGQPSFAMVHGMTPWEYRVAHPAESAVFDAAMTGISTAAVAPVVRSYDFSSLSVLADVGGGHGELLAGILTANPHLRGILLDQPHVVASAGPLLERAGVADRCEIVGGSFFDGVPPGVDAYLLKSVLHDWDDAAAVTILRACHAAMHASARLLVVEPIIRPGNEPDPMKFRDLLMLVMLGGRERTAEDFARLYAEAGFRLTSIIATGSPFSILEGTPA